MTADDSIDDPIDALFRVAAANVELSVLLDGKTAEEQHGILIGVLLSIVGQLARQDGTLAEQHKTMADMLRRMTDLIERLQRRVDELEALTPKNVRGPFIRPKPEEEGA